MFEYFTFNVNEPKLFIDFLFFMFEFEESGNKIALHLKLKLKKFLFKNNSCALWWEILSSENLVTQEREATCADWIINY